MQLNSRNLQMLNRSGSSSSSRQDVEIVSAAGEEEEYYEQSEDGNRVWNEAQRPVRQDTDASSTIDERVFSGAVMDDEIKNSLCRTDAPIAPVFPHGVESNGGWLTYDQVNGREDDLDAEPCMRPVRTLVFNWPKSALRPDAQRFRDMRSSIDNQTRATNVNALFGLLYTPLSKGWISGRHVEKEQENREEGAAPEENQQSKKKKVEEVDSYTFYGTGSQSGVELPMFVLCYEELYAEPATPDETPSEIVGFRFHELVFDSEHSKSELTGKLINENKRRMRHAGAAHCSNASRSNKLVQEHARAIKLVGGHSTENVALEYYAGNQYLRVSSMHDYLGLIRSYSGRTDSFRGFSPVDLDKLSPGALNQSLRKVSKYGGDSEICPERVFRGDSAQMLKAGCVEFDSTPLKVHHEQLDPKNYVDENGFFTVPSFVRNLNGFWIQTNPSLVHPYDMALPRPIAGVEAPGRALMELYASEKEPHNPLGADDPLMVNRFKNMTSGIDQTMAKMLREATDTIFSFDATEVSEHDRKLASMAKAGSKHGFSGSMEAGSMVIEPRQVLKEIADEASVVIKKLIGPWEEKQREKIALEEIELKKTLKADIKKAEDADEIELLKVEFAEKRQMLMNQTKELQDKLVLYNKELFEWYAEKYDRAHKSRYDRETIPPGWRASWDGLLEENKDNEDGSACMAETDNMQMTDSHKSVYAHAQNWLGRWFEQDCFFDGRDWRIMDTVFFGMFEIATTSMTVHVLSGEPGTAKSMRMKRLAASMSDGLVQQGGNKSARAGMQGNNDAHNGCLIYTDEMITSLEENDGGMDTEYHKQWCTERQVTYEKASSVKSSDGTEGHTSVHLRTYKYAKLVICTNRGGGYSKGSEEPTKVKEAMLNRSQAVHVRRHDGSTRTPDEFSKHQAKPEVLRRRACLRKATNLSIECRKMLLWLPHLRPNMTAAQTLWQEFDRRLVDKFGLHAIERRRNDKRLEDCISRTIWEKVWTVFGFKQTSVLFPEISKRNAAGKLPKFHPRQLYPVFQLLQPTREIALDAWTNSLELSASTSMTGTNVMSILAEAHHFHFTDLLCRSLDENNRFNVRDHVKPNDKESIKALQLPTAQEKIANDTSGVDNYAPPKETTPKFFSLFPQGASGGVRTGRFRTPELREMKLAAKRLRTRREATTSYRKACLNNTDNTIRNKDIIEIINSSSTDVKLSGSTSPNVRNGEESMDRLVSCITPDILMASVFYSPKDLLHWAIHEYSVSHTNGLGVKFSAFNKVSGTHPDRHYAQYGKANDGKMRYDFGWVRVVTSSVETEDATPKYKGCPDKRTLAKHLKGLPTQRRFCYHEESMKDALYLLAHEEENSRFLPEMPTMRSEACPYVAMTLEHAGQEAGVSAVRPTEFAAFSGEMKKKNKAVSAAVEDGWSKPRHPDSLVEDSDMQRRIDALILRNRLFATAIVASNYIAKEPPIRVYDNEIQVNAGILADHCALVAESVLACASIPGLKNAHEVFPDNGQAPMGLSTSCYKPQLGLESNNIESPYRFPLSNAKWNDPETSAWLLGKLAKDMPGLSSKTLTGNKRPRQDEASSSTAPMDVDSGATEAVVQSSDLKLDNDGNNPNELVFALPYSFDIVSIHLCVSMASLLFDDDVETDRAQLSKNFDGIGFKKDTEIAQLNLPFPGYIERGRQMLSLTMPFKQTDDDGFCHVSDKHSLMTSGEGGITKAYVSAHLGRAATDHDLREWCTQRMGATQWYGVSGNLFAQSVWRRHALASLKARGMIATETETVANLTRFASSQLFTRLVECMSKQEGSDFAHLGPMVSEPYSYRAVEHNEIVGYQLREEKRQKPSDDQEEEEEEGDDEEDDGCTMDILKRSVLEHDFGTGLPEIQSIF